MQSWILLAVKQNTNWGHCFFVVLVLPFFWFCVKFCWLKGLKDKEICNIVNSLNIGQDVSGCLSGERGFSHKKSLQSYCYFFCPSSGHVLKNICFIIWRAVWCWKAFDLLTLSGVYQKRVQTAAVFPSPSWCSTYGSPCCGCFPSWSPSSDTLASEVVFKKQ